MNDYIYYTTDGSFDYDGPFGMQTEHIENLHGFSIVLTNEDKPLIETLEGFGDYAEVNDIDNLLDLKEYILNHMNEIKDDGTDPDIFLELVEFIDEEVKKCA